jgi:hypothetical protein
MDTIIEKATLEEEIQRLTGELTMLDPTDSDYEIIAENLDKVVKIHNEQKKVVNKSGIDKNVLISAGTNILGILLVLNYEKLGIISSKAFSMIGKMR